MYFTKTLLGLALTSASFSIFAQTIPADHNAYCAQVFPIESCMGGDCQKNSLDTEMYLSCSQSYVNLAEAMTKRPVSALSFEKGSFGNASSYPEFTFRYTSLFQLAIKSEKPISYTEMLSAKSHLDKSYDKFHKGNEFLKKAYDIYKPFNTPETKNNYITVIKQQKLLSDPVAKAQNAVNFMLYNEQFYNLFLATYKKFYPHAIYNGEISNKKLSLYECQFINVTEDFKKIQSEQNFTCDTK